jgi:geranylgeranyl pyrophosphate synthase
MRTDPGMWLLQGQDLMSGNLTAPALYALRDPQAGGELRDLIDSEFNGVGGLPRAIELVNAGGGIESARTLARSHADQVRFHRWSWVGPPHDSLAVPV